MLLVAIGVTPVLPGGLEFKRDARGYLQTDDTYQTNVPGVYAAGDIIGPPWLAHVASWEAIQCIEGIFHGKTPRKVTVFPGCTYCQPQVASVGLTERAAKEKGIKYKVGKFPFLASGKAAAVGETEGFTKILFGEQYGEVLGAHIIGPEATELIAEMGLAINLEATHEEIEATIHAHPTLAEALHEATGAGVRPGDPYLIHRPGLALVSVPADDGGGNRLPVRNPALARRLQMGLEKCCCWPGEISRVGNRVPCTRWVMGSCSRPDAWPRARCGCTTQHGGGTAAAGRRVRGAMARSAAGQIVVSARFHAGF